MNIQERYLEYAEAFEVTFKDNDWSRLERYFTKEATYDSGDGEAAHGRAALMAKLEGAIDGLDRQMDTRALDFSAPTASGDTVCVDWTVVYTKAGVPDLQIGGKEYARFEGERIAELRDEFDPAAIEGLTGWLSEHGGSLSG